MNHMNPINYHIIQLYLIVSDSFYGIIHMIKHFRINFPFKKFLVDKIDLKFKLNNKINIFPTILVFNYE